MAAAAGVCASRAWGSVETVFTSPFSTIRVWLKSDGTFPNNDAHPLLIYQRVLTGADASQSRGAALLTENGWTSPWAWGVFSYHHYHSTAWEALLCVQGEADIQFGGPTGPTLHTNVCTLAVQSRSSSAELAHCAHAFTKSCLHACRSAISF